MRTVISTAMNPLACVGETGKLSPCLEVVLIYSEPDYTVDAGGLVRKRRVSDFRFTVSPAELRQIAKQLAEYADDTADRVEAAIADTNATTVGTGNPHEQH